MNRRTEALMDVAEAIKTYRARKEKVDKARGKLAETSAELKLYVEEQQKVEGGRDSSAQVHVHIAQSAHAR